MNLIRWYSVILVLCYRSAWAIPPMDSNVASTDGNHTQFGQSYFPQHYVMQQAVINLPNGGAHANGDPTASILQAAAVLQSQGNSRTQFVYDGITTASSCLPTQTVIRVMTSCPKTGCPVGHMAWSNCSGTPAGPWLITLYNNPGTLWVTWNRGGELRDPSLYDLDGTYYVTNPNRIEISQIILRAFLMIAGNGMVSDSSCLTGPATGTDLNKVLYYSRNALCEDEIMKLVAGYGSRPGTTCADARRTDGYYTNSIYKTTTASWLPTGSNFTAAVLSPSNQIGGAGGFDAVRGSDTGGIAPWGLFAESNIHVIDSDQFHPVKFNDYKGSGGLFAPASPFDSLRKPAVTFDPVHKVWWAFGFVRGSNTRNVSYWTSTDRANWTYHGLVRRTTVDSWNSYNYPNGCKDTPSCNTSCGMLKSPPYQIPIETRLPVSVAYEPGMNLIVVVYLDYSQDLFDGQDIVNPPPGPGQYWQPNGPSGAVSWTTISTTSDYSEKQWTQVWSNFPAGFIISSQAPVVSCSDLFWPATPVDPARACTIAFTMNDPNRYIATYDMYTDLAQDYPCTWQGTGGAGNQGGTVGISQRPPLNVMGASRTGETLVSTDIGGVNKQAMATVGTDNNIYITHRDNYGPWSSWTPLSNAISGGGTFIEPDYLTFTGAVTVNLETGYELLFTAKNSNDNWICQ